MGFFKGRAFMPGLSYARLFAPLLAPLPTPLRYSKTEFDTREQALLRDGKYYHISIFEAMQGMDSNS